MTGSHPYTNPNDDEDEDVPQESPPRINEESNNNGDPDGSFPASSTEKLRYPILSKLGVLSPSSSLREYKLDAISDILDEVFLFWWENRDKKTNDKLIINYRNNPKINLVPMMDAKTPMDKNKNLKIMMKCAGDGDVVSEVQCMMGACQSVLSTNSSDAQLSNFVRESQIPTMSKDETLALCDDCLLSRDKMYLLGSYLKQYIDSLIFYPLMDCISPLKKSMVPKNFCVTELEVEHGNKEKIQF